MGGQLHTCVGIQEAFVKQSGRQHMALFCAETRCELFRVKIDSLYTEMLLLLAVEGEEGERPYVGSCPCP